MTITSRLSRSLDLVKAFEVFHARATPQDGGFVIGYGHTASAREGAVVTRAQAEDLLIYDLGEIGKLLDAWVYAPMHGNQRQALIAFGFDVGAENLHRSTALRRLNAGDYMGCAREIERWRMAELAGRGQVVDALVRRRAAEKALFLTPPDGFLKTEGARLRPRFDGERTAPTVVADPPVGSVSAAMAAAHNVSARLRALLPDIEPPPPSDAEPKAAEADQPELDLAPPVEAQPENGPASSAVVPDRDAASDTALLDSILLEPMVLEPAPPQWRPSEPPPAEATAEADDDAPPPPPPFVPSSRPQPRLVSANDVGPDIRRQAEPPPPIAARPEPAAPAATSQRATGARLASSLALVIQHGRLMLGLLGVLLFVVSILLILTGKPSAANLAIGLVGVLCVTPSAYALLGPREG